MLLVYKMTTCSGS